MHITTPWLLQYLEPHVSHDALMQAFPRIGLEIEESHALPSGEGFFGDLNGLAKRPDMLGIIGVAREVAAHFDLTLKYPAINTWTLNSTGPAAVTVQIDDPDLCPRYMGRVITGVKVGPSPAWLRQLLEQLGQRPINN